MLEGDHPEHHEEAARRLKGYSVEGEPRHDGKGHSVRRAVHSVRPSGDVYLFVLCECCAELGFKLGAQADEKPRGRRRDEAMPA